MANDPPPRFEYTPRAAITALGSSTIYSDIVYWLKIVLPALAVAILLAISVWPNFIDSESRFQISQQDVANQAPQASVIIGPRYVGSNSQGMTYSIKAAIAAPSPQDTNAVNLEKLSVQLKSDNRRNLSMTADRATYWRNRNGMAADGRIAVRADSGEQIFTDKAYADFSRSVIWGDAPVRGQGPQGSFRAQGFEATQDGNVVLLRGRVQLSLLPSGKTGHKSKTVKP